MQQLFTFTGGSPVGARACSLYGQWQPPTWLSSCGTSLKVCLY